MIKSEWGQPGFVVVSGAAGELPMTHGFYLGKWEAENRLRQLNDCPEELRVDAEILPARLVFTR